MMSSNTSINFVFSELHPLIFRNSAPSDLLHCRLVNRTWHQVTTQCLLKSGSLKIKFHLGDLPSKENPSFCRIAYDDCLKSEMELRHIFPDGEKTLPRFFRLITKPPPGITPSLPLDHFDFRIQLGRINRNPPELTSFLQNYGPKIRALTLENCIDYFVGHRGRPNFILQYTPNLETLHISETLTCTRQTGLSADGSKPHKNVPVTSLPHLKFIEIDRRIYVDDESSRDLFSQPTAIILPQLLQIAPHLEQVSFKHLLDLNLTRIFIPSKINLLCVHGLCLNDLDLFHDVNRQRIVENFMEVLQNSVRGGGVKTLRLTVRKFPQCWHTWRKGSAVLTQLFTWNLNSLSQLSLFYGAAALLYRMENLPSLPSVKSLILTITWEYRHPKRSHDVLEFLDMDEDVLGNSWSEWLPNLEEFAFHVRNDSERDRVRGLIPLWNDRLMTVRTLFLELRQNDNDQVHESEAFVLSMNLCPEVKSLYATWPCFQFLRLVEPLWNLSQLTTLVLKIRINDSWRSHTFADLDAAFTGLSKETVQALYNNWEYSGGWAEGYVNVPVSRINPSILRLPNLQTLLLSFESMNFQEPRMVMSAVSAQFGFRFMENLRAVIIFEVFSSYYEAHSPENTRKNAEKKETWLELHRPLSYFANVSIG